MIFCTIYILLLNSKMSKMSTLIIYTDGGCDIKTRKGGWGVCVFTQNLKFLGSGYGGRSETTNNVMELHALHEALTLLKNEQPQKVIIRIDSKYTIGIFDGIRMQNEKIIYGKSWIGTWIKNKWDKPGGIKNLKQIQNIYRTLIFVLSQGHTIELEYCPAHVGIEGNELADDLANLGKNHKKSLKLNCKKMN